MRQVVLVGLMRSGRSTVGRLVAERTGRHLVDVDEAIADAHRQEGISSGTRAARLRTAISNQRSFSMRCTAVVLAAPGGVILDPAVRSALQSAPVAWLRAAPTTLADRVQPGDRRPLLGDHPFEALSAGAEARSELYPLMADVVVDTDDLTPEAEVLSRLRPDT